MVDFYCSKNDCNTSKLEAIVELQFEECVHQNSFDDLICRASLASAFNFLDSFWQMPSVYFAKLDCN